MNKSIEDKDIIKYERMIRAIINKNIGRGWRRSGTFTGVGTPDPVVLRDGSGVNLDDLMNSGRLWVMESLQRFDPNKDTKESAFVYRYLQRKFISLNNHWMRPKYHGMIVDGEDAYSKRNMTYGTSEVNDIDIYTEISDPFDNKYSREDIYINLIDNLDRVTRTLEIKANKGTRVQKQRERIKQDSYFMRLLNAKGYKTITALAKFGLKISPSTLYNALRGRGNLSVEVRAKAEYILEVPFEDLKTIYNANI